ncbi:MAG: site-specific integrase [Candidatus Pacebacteria bacterium]|nr:site-specific integrase [Candidatus Paceibacterota bacterium]
MAKLSKNLIRNLRANGREVVLWDDALPGFGVRTKKSGLKTYVLQYRNAHGRSKRLSLGHVGEVTLDQARREAIRLKGGISLGNDPAQQRADLRNGDTLRDLTDRYMTDHCEGRCKESTMDAHQWLLDKFILPRLGAFKITEVRPEDVANLHQALRNTPYNANRALGLIRAIYNKAEQWGVMLPNSNPATVIKPFRERKRQRYLSPDEFKALFRILDEQEALKVIGTYQAAAIRLLAVTGCRMGEILSLEWSSVDFINRRLLLDHHKTDHKGVKAIPLNAVAVRILENLPRVEDNKYVIVGRNEGTHLVNLQKPWRHIRKKAKLADVRIHDLRHSFASAAASAGVPLMMIGAMLGHSSPQTTARYAHLSQDPVKQASEIVGEVLRIY